jgi:hypothetical protein
MRYIVRIYRGVQPQPEILDTLCHTEPEMLALARWHLAHGATRADYIPVDLSARGIEVLPAGAEPLLEVERE